MDTKKAIITIEIEGGIDIGYNVHQVSTDNTTIKNLIKILQKRSPFIQSASEKVYDTDEIKGVTGEVNIKFHHIKQEIHIII